MRKINRDKEPDFWADYKNSHSGVAYKELNETEGGVEIRKKMRRHLVQSQNYLCAYCCRRINPENALNEHIKPQGQGKYAKYSMDYDNLIASCNTGGSSPTCSAKKGNEFNEVLFVSPLQNDCEIHFEFHPDGHIEGVTKEGEYTCDLLGLDSYALQRARKAMYQNCCAYRNPEMVKEYMLTPYEGKMEPFADMIAYFYQRGDFDLITEKN